MAYIWQIERIQIDGSFGRYRGTDSSTFKYFQQKNNTTKQESPHENPFVWFLCFFCNDGTCRKTKTDTIVVIVAYKVIPLA